MSLLSKLSVALINRYQRLGGGSKLFNTDCNFEPTCSEYAKQAIEAKGILAAFPIIVNRLRRCNETDKVGRDLDPFLENSDV